MNERDSIAAKKQSNIRQNKLHISMVGWQQMQNWIAATSSERSSLFSSSVWAYNGLVYPPPNNTPLLSAFASIIVTLHPFSPIFPSWWRNRARGGGWCWCPNTFVHSVLHGPSGLPLHYLKRLWVIICLTSWCISFPPGAIDSMMTMLLSMRHKWSLSALNGMIMMLALCQFLLGKLIWSDCLGYI